MTPFLQNNKWNPILKIFTLEVNFIMKQGAVYSRIMVTRSENLLSCCHFIKCLEHEALKLRAWENNSLLFSFCYCNGNTHILQLRWSTKILSHEKECLFLMYFWTLNSNMFPEFLYHPHLLHCIRPCESTSLHLWVTGGPVGGSLDM